MDVAKLPAYIKKWLLIQPSQYKCELAGSCPFDWNMLYLESETKTHRKSLVHEILQVRVVEKIDAGSQ